MLKSQDISFQYHDFNLINHIDLHIKKNELAVIIGPNGAGKSTLLKLLSGYLTPTHGECALLDRDLKCWRHKELSQTRAVMTQTAPISFSFTGREVIAMGRAPYGRQYFDESINDVIDQIECHGLCHKEYQTLSGGEKQKIQLAKALAQLWTPSPTPKLLFLDEPTSALDLYHQQVLLRVLKKLTTENELTVCCILHDLNLAALYADKIILMKRGKIISTGSPKEVLTKERLNEIYQADIIINPHPHYDVPQIHLQQ